MEENKVIKNNAVTAYLLFLISVMFLFAKSEPNLNNEFVRKHTKSALLIHLLIIINILVFKTYGLLGSIFIMGYSLNSIVFSSILAILFLMLIFGAYRASKGEYFNIGSIFSAKSSKKLLNVDNDGNFGEKDKLTFVLAYIPFVGQIFASKYSKNENIKEILRLNTFVVFLSCLLFINFYNNLNQVFILIYAIFVAFVGVNLFGKSDLIVINLPKYFSFSELLKLFKVVCKYMKNYISGNFKEFKILEQEQENIQKQDEIDTYNKTKDLPELKGPKKIIYFPIINLFFIFFKENQYQIHIRNALTISFLMIITIILIVFGIIGKNTLILFLFPICYGIGNLGKIYYKIPLIYDIYLMFNGFISFFKRSKKTISEKRKEVKETNFKIETKASEEENTEKHTETRNIQKIKKDKKIKQEENLEEISTEVEDKIEEKSEIEK
ncbi:hypothetical protein D8B46_07040 [Candidatus Gracilibacteria bacterium]|nr:MAG: hypothetical protein D8B46_07040 [Candidatus Gracilibacteria bacterium]